MAHCVRGRNAEWHEARLSSHHFISINGHAPILAELYPLGKRPCHLEPRNVLWWAWNVTDGFQPQLRHELLRKHRTTSPSMAALRQRSPLRRTIMILRRPTNINHQPATRPSTSTMGPTSTEVSTARVRVETQSLPVPHWHVTKLWYFLPTFTGGQGCAY